MEWLIVHSWLGRYFWPRPPLAPEPNKTRMQFLTQEKQDHEPGLAVQPLAWVHREVAVFGSFLHSELSSLGYAGVGLTSWPPRPSQANHLSYTSSTTSSTLPSCGRVWLGHSPPATPSYLLQTMTRASKLCHPSPTSALVRWWRSSILFSMGMHGNVGWYDRWWRGAGRNLGRTSYADFTTGQKNIVFIQYFYNFITAIKS